MRGRGSLRFGLAAGAVGLALVVSACGGGGETTGSATGGASETTQGQTVAVNESPPTAACGGEPIKVMTIAALTGQLSAFGSDLPDAAKAAEQSINEGCSLGRPLEVTVCDDKSTANGSLACGREADEKKMLALVGQASSPGGSGEGSEAARLPAVFNFAASSWDNTSPLSYPSFPGGLTTAGMVKVAAARGAKSFTYAGAELPSAKLSAEIGKSVAEAEGVDYEELFYPATQTDTSSVASQLVSSGTESFTPTAPALQPFIQSLISAGANFEKMIYVGGYGILKPKEVSELYGQGLRGYSVGSVIGTSVEDNPGIEEMKQEYEKAGVEFSTDLNVFAVHEWNSIHALALALEPLAKSGEIESLNSEGLVKAVVDHGEYNLPSEAPFDFSKPAKFTNSGLAKAFGEVRMFTTSLFVYELTEGKEVPVGEAQDVNEEFEVPSS